MTKFCCERMSEMVGYRCKVHSDRFECPDCLVEYWPNVDEYGLIVHDGGGSIILINYCPWCGTRLPESKRDE